MLNTYFILYGLFYFLIFLHTNDNRCRTVTTNFAANDVVFYAIPPVCYSPDAGGRAAVPGLCTVLVQR